MKPVFWTFLIALLFAHPAAAAGDPLTGLDFLVGKWHGKTQGAAGTDVFQRELDGHVLQRRSQSVVAAAGGKPNGSPHGSMQAQLTVYPTGQGDALAAIYFDNEGHVIHYNQVTVTPGERVEFSSGGGAPGPVFRLTYSSKTRGVLHVKFEMAPPGQSSFNVIAEADETPSR